MSLLHELGQSKAGPPRPRTREQIRAEALEQINRGPQGYWWRLHATHATPEQLAIVKSADEEIKALRALVRSLGGEV